MTQASLDQYKRKRKPMFRKAAQTKNTCCGAAVMPSHVCTTPAGLRSQSASSHNPKRQKLLHGVQSVPEVGGADQQSGFSHLQEHDDS